MPTNRTRDRMKLVMLGLASSSHLSMAQSGRTRSMLCRMWIAAGRVELGVRVEWRAWRRRGLAWRGSMDGKWTECDRVHDMRAESEETKRRWREEEGGRRWRAMGGERAEVARRR